MLFMKIYTLLLMAGRAGMSVGVSFVIPDIDNVRSPLTCGLFCIVPLGATMKEHEGMNIIRTRGVLDKYVCADLLILHATNIVTLPVNPCKPKKFYLIFWRSDFDLTCVDITQFVHHILKVDV